MGRQNRVVSTPVRLGSGSLVTHTTKKKEKKREHGRNRLCRAGFFLLFLSALTPRLEWHPCSVATLLLRSPPVLNRSNTKVRFSADMLAAKRALVLRTRKQSPHVASNSGVVAYKGRAFATDPKSGAGGDSEGAPSGAPKREIPSQSSSRASYSERYTGRYVFFA
jgi:hypothetical protein